MGKGLLRGQHHARAAGPVCWVVGATTVRAQGPGLPGSPLTLSARLCPTFPEHRGRCPQARAVPAAPQLAAPVPCRPAPAGLHVLLHLTSANLINFSGITTIQAPFYLRIDPAGNPRLSFLSWLSVL